MASPSSCDTNANDAEKFLGEYSPHDLLQSEHLLSYFHQFCRRGTASQCWELFPEDFRRAIASSLYTAPRAASPQPRPQLQLPLSEPSDGSYRHFSSLNLPPSKVALLNKVTKGIVNVLNLREEEYLQLWPLEDVSTSKKTKELAVSVCGASTECAGPLRLLFFAHSVDHIETTVKRRNGQRKRSAAFEEIANQCNIGVQKVRDACKRKRNYITFAEKWGLGCLLELGANMSDLESLAAEDIDSLSSYLEQDFSEILHRYRSLGLVAAKVVIQGLRFYGWSFDELAQCKSELMGLVSQCVNIEELKYGRVRQREDGSHGDQLQSVCKSHKRRKKSHGLNMSETNPVGAGYCRDLAMGRSTGSASTSLPFVNGAQNEGPSRLPPNRPMTAAGLRVGMIGMSEESQERVQESESNRQNGTEATRAFGVTKLAANTDDVSGTAPSPSEQRISTEQFTLPYLLISPTRAQPSHLSFTEQPSPSPYEEPMPRPSLQPNKTLQEISWEGDHSTIESFTYVSMVSEHIDDVDLQSMGL